MALQFLPAALAPRSPRAAASDDDAGAVATPAPATTTAPADRKSKKFVPGGDSER